MDINVIDLSGNSTKTISSALFDEDYRPDLIKKAVLAAQANRQQPYGPHFMSGMNTSAENWGPGRAVARVPRLKDGRRGARVPQAVKGRRAHPPKPEADRTEKVNKKERRKAIRSALAATANPGIVADRGHIHSANLPLVVVDELSSIARTKDVVSFMAAANLSSDLLRARTRTIRAGKGKLRGRKYKKHKSVLIVTAEDNGISKAARNIPGVDVITYDQLNTELLAPGTHAGRLTVFTESAIAKLEEVLQ